MRRCADAFTPALFYAAPGPAGDRLGVDRFPWVQAMKHRYRDSVSNRYGRTNVWFASTVSHRDCVYANCMAILMWRVSLLVRKAEFETLRMFAIAAFY